MNKKIFFGLLALLFVVGLGMYGYTTYKPSSSGTVSNMNEAAIQTVVEHFATTLKDVSLLAPDASAQIQAKYSAYASPELVAQWAADPSHAPGRQVSSPWPDHIQILSIVPRASGNAFESYQVEGNIIEVVSASNNATAPAGVYPVSITLQKQGEGWVITSWSEGVYSELPQSTTITGIWECLPHKDRTGPQTMECAFGIAKDQSDGHYAIDTSLMSTYPVDFPTGAHVKVQGVITPVEALSSIQKYDIDGIIRATSIEQL